MAVIFVSQDLYFLKTKSDLQSTDHIKNIHFTVYSNQSTLSNEHERTVLWNK